MPRRNCVIFLAGPPFGPTKITKNLKSRVISFGTDIMDPQAVPHNDLYIFSEQNLLAQLETAPVQSGYKIVRFYVDAQGLLAKENTGTTDIFYLSPSGGALRDKDLNIVLYSARYDMYRGLTKAKK